MRAYRACVRVGDENAARHRAESFSRRRDDGMMMIIISIIIIMMMMETNSGNVLPREVVLVLGARPRVEGAHSDDQVGRRLPRKLVLGVVDLVDGAQGDA